MLIIKLYHLQVRDFRSTGTGTFGSKNIRVENIQHLASWAACMCC